MHQPLCYFSSWLTICMSSPTEMISLASKVVSSVCIVLWLILLCQLTIAMEPVFDALKCCTGAYLYVEVNETSSFDSLFDQVNLHLHISYLARMRNRTHILSNILISTDDSILTKELPTTNYYDAVPFEQVFEAIHLQQQCFPRHCVLTIEQSATLCGLHSFTTSLDGNKSIEDDDHRQPHFIDRNPSVLILSPQSVYRSQPVLLSHDGFVSYREFRDEQLAVLRPSIWLQYDMFPKEIAQRTTTGGRSYYIALHLPSALATYDTSNTRFHHHVVAFVQGLTPSDEIKYVYTSSQLALTAEHMHLWKDAGYKVIQYQDIFASSSSLPIFIRDLIDFTLFSNAAVFYGHSANSLSTNTFEFRHAQKPSLPSYDINQPVSSCCRGGVGYSHIKQANRGLVQLQITLKIVMWGAVTDGPTGGAAHFFLALRRAFERMGHKVYSISHQHGIPRDLSTGKVRADMHILNQFQFPPSALSILKLYPGGLVVVRTDGPFYLHRGSIQQDHRLYEIIKQHAHVIVFQSQWSLDMTRQHGLLNSVQHIRQVIIGNAAEPSYFYPKRNVPSISVSNKDYKLKVCSSVYSDNTRKNFYLVSLLAGHQQNHNFELRLAGNVPSNYSHVLNATLMDEFHLGQFLRQCDVFFTASWFECFSNAEVQALACSLPVVALNDSSHASVVQGGGLVFGSYADRFDVSKALDAIAMVKRDYERYIKDLPVYDINKTAAAFLALLTERP